MAFRGWTRPIDDERFFVAEEKITPNASDWPYPKNIDNDKQLLRFVQDRFSRAYTAMLPEFAKMRMCERLYMGLHYLDPNDNFNNEITNYAFSLVETIWPELVAERPRPLIVPRSGTRAIFDRVKKHQRLAQWWMDMAGFDRWKRRSMRPKLKFGWNVSVLLPNVATGIPYVKHWSNWHFFKDPAATSMENMMYCFLAGPAPLAMVKATFGEKANGLRSDDYVSPGWSVLIRAYNDFYLRRDMDGTPSPSWVTSAITTEAQQPGSLGDTWLVPMSGEREIGGETTFLPQMFFRDLTKVKVAYRGMVHHRGSGIAYPTYMMEEDYVCESGWRVATIGTNGKVLQCAPLDEAWGGLNIVVGHDYEHEDRFFGIGEIEQIASKVRAINRSNHLLANAEAFEMLPIVIRDQQSAVDLNRTSFSPGDSITKRPNTEIKILEFRGISNAAFNLQAERKKDLQDVSGVSPAQEGQRPPGIEAAAAYRAILQQALKRTMGKVPQYLDEMSVIVKKAMLYMSKKIDTGLGFMANDGQELTIEPSELEYEWDLRFDESTATMGGKMIAEDKLLQLAQLGVVDQQYVIEQMELPGGVEMVQRLQAQQQAEYELRVIEALVAGQTAAEGGGPPGRNGKSGAGASRNGEQREMSRSRAKTHA